MAANKRYFWLKLKDDFFGQKEIKKLRRVAGGDTYTIIYLKLQLLSLKTNGKIFYEEFEETFYDEMALTLDEKSDNVKFTLIFLENYGLIEKVSENEFFLPKVEDSTGSETSVALRVREHRERKKELQCNTIETNCNVEKRREEIEKEKEIENNNNKNSDSDCDCLNIYEQLGFGTINSVLLEDLEILKKDYTEMWVIEALKEAAEQGIRNLKYTKGILKNWKSKGFKAEKNKENKNSKQAPGSGFNNFKARDYDYDDLEKKLLGY